MEDITIYCVDDSRSMTGKKNNCLKLKKDKKSKTHLEYFIFIEKTCCPIVIFDEILKQISWDYYLFYGTDIYILHRGRNFLLLFSVDFQRRVFCR